MLLLLLLLPSNDIVSEKNSCVKCSFSVKSALKLNLDHERRNDVWGRETDRNNRTGKPNSRITETEQNDSTQTEQKNWTELQSELTRGRGAAGETQRRELNGKSCKRLSGLPNPEVSNSSELIKQIQDGCGGRTTRKQNPENTNKTYNETETLITSGNITGVWQL